MADGGSFEAQVRSPYVFFFDLVLTNISHSLCLQFHGSTHSTTTLRPFPMPRHTAVTAPVTNDHTRRVTNDNASLEGRQTTTTRGR